jgi:hypothetical protein
MNEAEGPTAIKPLKGATQQEFNSSNAARLQKRKAAGTNPMVA